MPAKPTLEALSTSFDYLVRRRRATPHFTDEPVPPEAIETALTLAAEAPSGYNFQPWRFIIVRNDDLRARLKGAAFNQPKVAEAPVMIVACAERDQWQTNIDQILLTRARKTGQSADNLDQVKRSALDFINTLPREVWLNRHVMIAFTYLMLAFESLGWDTAPMEGFNPKAVREVLGLPSDAEVIALLAVGRNAGSAPAHPGRLSINDIAFGEHYGEPLATTLHAVHS